MFEHIAFHQQIRPRIIRPRKPRWSRKTGNSIALCVNGCFRTKTLWCTTWGAILETDPINAANAGRAFTRPAPLKSISGCTQVDAQKASPYFCDWLTQFLQEISRTNANSAAEDLGSGATWNITPYHYIRTSASTSANIAEKTLPANTRWFCIAESTRARKTTAANSARKASEPRLIWKITSGFTQVKNYIKQPFGHYEHHNSPSAVMKYLFLVTITVSNNKIILFRRETISLSNMQ